MSDEAKIPEEIREKLLEKEGESEEELGPVDEIDLDRVAGGAYSGINVTSLRTKPRFGFGTGDIDPSQP